MAAGVFSHMIDIAHYFPSGKKLEIDAVRARKAVLKEQKRHEQELANPQVDGSASSALLGASTGSRLSSPTPAVPAAGPSPPQKRARGIPLVARGDTCDAGGSCATGGSSYWDRTQGIVSEDDLSQVANLSEEQMDELLVKNMARALAITTAARNRGAMRLAEMGRLAADLKQRESDFSLVKGERDEALESVAAWERRYEQEVSTGKRFLASACGAAFITKTREEAVSQFQESAEFETIITDRVASIYDDAIRKCRRVIRQTLHGKGRFGEDDIGLLDPEVSEGEE
ncbi:UNVERIFIED_CONTAM: hypothetical protein Slati_0973800 [Sesamum latifolium]|uniref:Uncharacterized protein n=1 Tax=Sesamum latifolium TaxID=2727402 RepID=A0AAW2XUB9_9LAMI